MCVIHWYFKVNDDFSVAARLKAATFQSFLQKYVPQCVANIFAHMRKLLRTTIHSPGKIKPETILKKQIDLSLLAGAPERIYILVSLYWTVLHLEGNVLMTGMNGNEWCGRTHEENKGACGSLRPRRACLLHFTSATLKPSDKIQSTG